jgi:hypothetical protein
VTGSSTGIASVHAPGASDLILRNVNTVAFEVYDIAGSALVGGASLGPVGLDWHCGLPTFARKLRLVFRPTHHGPRSARPFRANAGNGGRFDQVLCSACVVGPRQDFPKLWRAKKPLNRNWNKIGRRTF